MRSVRKDCLTSIVGLILAGAAPSAVAQGGGDWPFAGKDFAGFRYSELDPKPFTWTKTPGQILAKLDLLNAPVH